MKLAHDSIVLDVACRIGSNFKAIESHLSEKGVLVRIDVYSESLKLARRHGTKHNWENTHLAKVSILDEVTFTNSSEELTYLNERIKRGRITRQGSRTLRWILIQATHNACRNDEGFRSLFERVRRRRGENKATVCLEQIQMNNEGRAQLTEERRLFL